MGLVLHCGVGVDNGVRAEENTARGGGNSAAGSGARHNSNDNGGGRLVRPVT